MKTIRTILERIKLLMIKMISVKGLVFTLATILKFCNILDSVIWFFVAVLIVSTRMFEKLIDKIASKIIK